MKDGTFSNWKIKISSRAFVATSKSTFLCWRRGELLSQSTHFSLPHVTCSHFILLYSGFDGWWCKGNEKFLFEHQRIKLGLVSIKNQTWGLVGFQFRFSPSLLSRDGIGSRFNGWWCNRGAQYVAPIYCDKVKMCWFSLGNWFFYTKFVQLAAAGKKHNTVVHLQKRV